MDQAEKLMNIVMYVATIVMFIKGWVRGLDMFDLIFNNVYLVTLILYLTKINFLQKGDI